MTQSQVRPTRRSTSVVRLLAALGATALLTGTIPAPVTAQQVNTADQLARAEDLKLRAFMAVGSGKFDKAEQLIEQAIQIAPDPLLKTMDGWLSSYADASRAALRARTIQYDDAVADVLNLQANGHDGFAADSAARAYSYAIDKEAFHRLSWVRELLTRTERLADEAEANNRWLEARRLYGDLSALQPAQPQWKKRLNEVNRRVLLLNMYAPDLLEQAFNEEIAARDAAMSLIDPEHKPTLLPDGDLSDDSFRIDWRTQLQDVDAGMLRESLNRAVEIYFRPVGYSQLVRGGVRQLEMVLTTAGLQVTFPKLADQHARQVFADALKDVLEQARLSDDRNLVRSAIDRLLRVNSESIDLPRAVIIAEFANGAFAELDQFTNVIWPADVPEFEKSTQGVFSGVGIQISSDEDGWLKVVMPIADTPAMRAGIQPDDVITHINGKSAKGITTGQAVRHITGLPGTSVQLTIRSPDSSVRELTLTRGVIKVDSVKGWMPTGAGTWNYMIDAQNGIGYIRLSSFTQSSSSEVTAALNDIRGAGGRAVILDLRNNPGGLLPAATDITDRFLSDGPIVSIRSERRQDNPAPFQASRREDDVDMPVIVLVNQHSASASEIVSGALKDRGRALIVGERTFGKGSVQQVYFVADRRARFKLTTSRYYLPSGRCIHRDDEAADWGVEPNVKVELTPEQMREVIRLRQQTDVPRDRSRPATAPAGFDSVESQILATDQQLGAAVLLMRMKLAGAPVM